MKTKSHHKHHRSKKHEVKEPEVVTYEQQSDEAIKAMEEILDAESDEPINPDSLLNGKHSRGYSAGSNAGWKYYRMIRPVLPDWWTEFNEAQNPRTGLLKFTTVGKLAKAKTKRKQEQQWIRMMLGPKLSKEAQKEVPWLGDWVRRRQNGFDGLRNLRRIKPLADAIKRNLQAGEAVRASAPLLLREWMRLERMQHQVDMAFGGNCFLEDQSPVSSENRKRSKAYFNLQKALMETKFRLTHEWMRVHGVDPQHPHDAFDPMLLAGAQIGTAAAMSGMAAGQHMLGNGQVDPSITAEAQTAMVLSKHLLAMRNTFHRSNTVIEAAQNLEKEEEAAVSKGNGKLQ